MTMLGRKHSEETKQKMRLSAIARGDCGGAQKLVGTKRPPGVVEKMKRTMFKKGQRPWNFESPYYQIRGENHPMWKGGVTPEVRRVRNSLEYKIWRRGVFARDNYTCMWCGLKSQKGQKAYLHADHIKPFALFPELRFALDNGRTLCEECHYQRHRN